MLPMQVSLLILLFIVLRVSAREPRRQVRAKKRTPEPIKADTPTLEDATVKLSSTASDIAILAGEKVVTEPTVIEVGGGEEPVKEKEMPVEISRPFEMSEPQPEMGHAEEMLHGAPPPLESGVPSAPQFRPPPPPGSLPTPPKARKPNFQLSASLNPNSTKLSSVAPEKTIYGGFHQRLQEFNKQLSETKKKVEEAKKGGDKEETEFWQEIMNNITLLPPERAAKFQASYTKRVLNKEEMKALKEQAQAKGAKNKNMEVELLEIPSKNIQNILLQARAVKAELLEKQPAAEREYEKATEVPDTEVVRAVRSMDPRLDESEAIKLLLPSSETCAAAAKLEPNQVHENLGVAGKLMHRFCQEEYQTLKSSSELQSILSQVRDTLDRLDKRVKACSKTAQSILESEALRKIVTEATTVVAHIKDQFGMRGGPIEYLSLADVLKMGEQPYLNVALDAIEDVELLGKLVEKDFVLIKEAAASECTFLGRELNVVKKDMEKLRGALESVEKNEGAYKTITEMDFSLGILARKDSIMSQLARVPDIEANIKRFEEIFQGRVFEFLGAQPLLCPSPKDLDEIAKLDSKPAADGKKLSNAKDATTTCKKPSEARTSYLYTVIEYLVDYVEKYRKNRLTQLALEEKLKAKEKPAKERRKVAADQLRKRKVAGDVKELGGDMFKELLAKVALID